MASPNRDAVPLVDAIDPLNEPSDAEVQAYAAFLGILSNESHLLWIARRGLKQALPPPWQHCRDAGKGCDFYTNAGTGQTQKTNPLDELNKELVRLHQTASSEGREHASNLRPKEDPTDSKSTKSGISIKSTCLDSDFGRTIRCSSSSSSSSSSSNSDCYSSKRGAETKTISSGSSSKSGAETALCHEPWVKALEHFELAVEVRQSTGSAKAAVALALLIEQKAMQVPNVVALSHYCDPLGNISFYRGQVMTINTAAISPTSSRHSLTPILQPKVQEQQQQRTQHSIPNGKNAAVAAAAAAAAVQMPCGLGVQLVKTGHRSSGCFVRGLQHGHGVQRHPNGSVAYAGEYMGGEKHGLGSFFDEVGTLRHSGAWYRNAPRIEAGRASSISRDVTDEAAATTNIGSPIDKASVGIQRSSKSSPHNLPDAIGTAGAHQEGLTTSLPPPISSPPRQTRPALRPLPPATAKTAVNPSTASTEGGWRSPLVQRRRVFSIGADGQRVMPQSPSTSAQYDACNRVKGSSTKDGGDIPEPPSVNRVDFASPPASPSSSSSIPPASTAMPSLTSESKPSKICDRETLMEVARAFSRPASEHRWEYEYWMHWGSARPLRDWEGVTVGSRTNKTAAAVPVLAPLSKIVADDDASVGSAEDEPKGMEGKPARGIPRAKSAVVEAVVVKLDLSPMGSKAGGTSKVTSKTAFKGNRSESSAASAGGIDIRAGNSAERVVFGIPVPRALSSLHSLRELNLCGLGLTGSVPENFASLGGTLTHLNLSGNKLTGRLDAELPWASLTRLERLGLADNCLYVLPIHPAAVLAWSGGDRGVDHCGSNRDSNSTGGNSINRSGDYNQPCSTPRCSPSRLSSPTQTKSSSRRKGASKVTSLLNRKCTTDNVPAAAAGRLLYLNLRGNLRPTSADGQFYRPPEDSLSAGAFKAASRNSSSWGEVNSCNDIINNNSSSGSSSSSSSTVLKAPPHLAASGAPWIAGVVEADLVGDPRSLLGKLAHWYGLRSSMHIA